jgi:hypothetical protein
MSQLEPHFPNPFPSREEPPPADVEIIDGEEHYEIKQTVDSKLNQRYKTPAKQLRYYVKWLGYENVMNRLFILLPEPEQPEQPDH